MSAGNNTNIEGFVHVVRLAWAVHLMLTQDQSTMTDAPSSASSRDLANICSCLEVICSNNVFQFLLGNVIKTAAYQV